ncbi:helix-turn-helix transcriptional regulator [Streptomyces sp. NPDC000410]|uniref:response regulator transcription factor n=1 Tax=Streptomyces sp. NPDC000410 TaxID=3154254 RepID=UPI003328CAF6
MHDDVQPVAITSPRRPALSLREQQILRHIARGHTYGATARRIGISVHTVDSYLRRVRAKFGIHSHAELIRLAVALEP